MNSGFPYALLQAEHGNRPTTGAGISPVDLQNVQDSSFISPKWGLDQLPVDLDFGEFALAPLPFQTDPIQTT